MKSKSTYTFQRATSDDLTLLATWHSAPHVREWWDSEEPYDSGDLADPRVARWIVSFADQPFAFMQDYTVHGWADHHFAHLPEGSRGIDQFIGEPDMVGCGHGSAFIKQRMDDLFCRGAPVIATDPHPDNKRAIAVYGKVGFKPLGPTRETKWGLILPMAAKRYLNLDCLTTWAKEQTTMIMTKYARTMARYDRWQNQSLIAAAEKMTDEDRWKDRGAFFGSIAETLNHILWDHRVWLARQRGDSTEAGEIGARHPYTDAPRDWSEYKREREALDEEISLWCDSLTNADVSREVEWMRGGTPVETNFGFNLVHMFNHATHHRGQVHAMLTSAGIDPGSTDLPMLPEMSE